jgi:hypothetical protein
MAEVGKRSSRLRAPGDREVQRPGAYPTAYATPSFNPRCVAGHLPPYTCVTVRGGASGTDDSCCAGK